MSEIPENYNSELNDETFETAENSAVQGFFGTPYPTEDFIKADEKKKIKQSANLIGISCFIIIVISFLLGIGIGVTTIVGQLLGTKDFLSDPGVMQVVQIVFSISVFTIPFIAPQKLGRERISDLMSFSKSKEGTTLPMLFFGLAFCAFANIGAAFIDQIFSSFCIDYSMPISDIPKGVFGFLISLIATALVPAIVEEFAFRGIVLGSLRRYGDGFALICSSVCFGFMHGNFEQIPFAFIVGLILGYIVIQSGSLRIAMVVHFINNAISVCFNYIPNNFSEEILSVVYSIYLLSVLVIAIFCLKKSKNDFFVLKEAEMLTDSKTKYKTFFLSPWILVFIILNLLQAVSAVLVSI